jgi:hypothetical protein
MQFHTLQSNVVPLRNQRFDEGQRATGATESGSVAGDAAQVMGQLGGNFPTTVASQSDAVVVSDAEDCVVTRERPVVTHPLTGAACVKGASPFLGFGRGDLVRFLQMIDAHTYACMHTHTHILTCRPHLSPNRMHTHSHVPSSPLQHPIASQVKFAVFRLQQATLQMIDAHTHACMHACTHTHTHAHIYSHVPSSPLTQSHAHTHSHMLSLLLTLIIVGEARRLWSATGNV